MSNKIGIALDILGSIQIPISPDTGDRLRMYLELIREWNDTVSLVSRGDLEWLDDHVADSLSLAPYITMGKSEEYLLDIGPGAGFPAIPLAIVLPEVRIVLVERSDRKCGFLRKVIAKFGLFHVELRCGAYPELGLPEWPRWITARAVERPEVLRDAILNGLGPETKFLCQGKGCGELDTSGFVATEIADEWSLRGLRRGSLTVIGRSRIA